MIPPRIEPMTAGLRMFLEILHMLHLCRMRYCHQVSFWCMYIVPTCGFVLVSPSRFQPFLLYHILSLMSRLKSSGSPKKSPSTSPHIEKPFPEISPLMGPESANRAFPKSHMTSWSTWANTDSAAAAAGAAPAAAGAASTGPDSSGSSSKTFPKSHTTSWSSWSDKSSTAAAATQASAGAANPPSSPMRILETNAMSPRSPAGRASADFRRAESTDHVTDKQRHERRNSLEVKKRQEDVPAADEATNPDNTQAASAHLTLKVHTNNAASGGSTLGLQIPQNIQKELEVKLAKAATSRRPSHAAQDERSCIMVSAWLHDAAPASCLVTHTLLHNIVVCRTIVHHGKRLAACRASKWPCYTHTVARNCSLSRIGIARDNGIDTASL